MSTFFIITMLLFSNVTVHAMFDDVNAQDIYGRTALHRCALLPDEIERLYPQFSGLMESDRVLTEYDYSRAQRAATLIAHPDINMHITDYTNRSAFDQAQMNQEYLPRVFAVIMAGHLTKRLSIDFYSMCVPPATHDQQERIDVLSALLSPACRDYVKIYFGSRNLIRAYANDDRA